MSLQLPAVDHQAHLIAKYLPFPPSEERWQLGRVIDQIASEDVAPAESVTNAARDE